MSPLAATPPHLRNIASAGVGLASNPPQSPPRRVAPYKGTPPTGPLLSSSPLVSPYSSPRFSDGSPPSIGAAGVGLFSPSPSPSPPQHLGITPRRATPSPQSKGYHPFGIQTVQQTQAARPQAEKFGQKERIGETEKATLGAKSTRWVFTTVSGLGSPCPQLHIQNT